MTSRHIGRQNVMCKDPKKKNFQEAFLLESWNIWLSNSSLPIPHLFNDFLCFDPPPPTSPTVPHPLPAYTPFSARKFWEQKIRRYVPAKSISPLWDFNESWNSIVNWLLSCFFCWCLSVCVFSLSLPCYLCRGIKKKKKNLSAFSLPAMDETRQNCRIVL